MGHYIRVDKGSGIGRYRTPAPVYSIWSAGGCAGAWYCEHYYKRTICRACHRISKNLDESQDICEHGSATFMCQMCKDLRTECENIVRLMGGAEAGAEAEPELEPEP